MTLLTRSLPLTLATFTVAALITHQWRAHQGGIGWGHILGGTPVANIQPGQQSMAVPGVTVPSESRIAEGDLPLLQQLNAEYSELVAAVMPSVVSITTRTRIVQPEMAFDWDSFGWRRFDRQFVRPGLGSGAIVSSEGHVITNHHVISGVDQILVRTADGESHTASIVGYDEEIDVAVLKIEVAEDRETDFPALPFGDSDVVEVGELVFAVGNPFGLRGTVTQGIISAKERRISESGFDLFQTDTVINPGNSGGPLVNLRGEIIGLNVAIFSGQQEVRVWQGVGLAIPSNDVEDTFAAIMNRGEPVLGYLGVDLEDTPIDPAIDGPDSAPLVVAVEPNSPAEQAGLKAGDILLKLGGRSIRSSRDFLRLVRQSPIDRALRLTILRDQREVTIDARVAERPRLLTDAANNGGPVVEARSQTIDDLLGIEVRELSSDERRALSRFIPSAPGLLVTRVRPDSPANKLLEDGDLLIRLNDRPLFRIDDFQAGLNDLPVDREAVLRYLRGRRIHTLRFMPRG